MKYATLVFALFILITSPRAYSEERCLLESEKLIAEATLLSKQKKISESELQIRLDAAFDLECREVFECLKNRKLKGLSLQTIDRARMTYEEQCSTKIDSLETEMNYSGFDLSDVLTELRAECADGHELFSQARRKLKRRR